MIDLLKRNPFLGAYNFIADVEIDFPAKPDLPANHKSPMGLRISGHSCKPNLTYRAFPHDVTAAMLVFQNKGMAAMMVYQTNPLRFELYFYANTFFCFSNPIWLLVT